MKYALVGAFLITLPAIVALVYGAASGNRYLVIAAVASVTLNTLPFIAAGLLLRNSDDSDLSH